MSGFRQRGHLATVGLHVQKRHVCSGRAGVTAKFKRATAARTKAGGFRPTNVRCGTWRALFLLGFIRARAQAPSRLRRPFVQKGARSSILIKASFIVSPRVSE